MSKCSPPGNDMAEKIGKKRPSGFVDIEQVFNVIERSIDSVLSWAELTNDRFHPEERVEELNELKDILVELTWRYGRDHVEFSFTQRKKIPETFPVEDVISTYWEGRVWIHEDPVMTKVYINF